MHKHKHILAAPFAFSPYGYTANTAYQNILELHGANHNSAQYFPSNLLQKYCQIHQPVTPITALSSRIVEMALGLGEFRYAGAMSNNWKLKVA